MSDNNEKFPKKYEHTEAEKKWADKWQEWEIYKWDSDVPREDTFVVDTPPPTVSGALHIGHVFSYTHTDTIVRFQRMSGKSIFYPMGWDDNGLPTERLVQNHYGIRCEPHVPYKPDWKPVPKTGKDIEIEDVSRKNFIEACEILTVEEEEAFKQLWTRLGLSVEWGEEYATIDNRSRRASQASFLDLVKKGQVYSSKAPNMWDVDFKCAIAQAELEDREIGGAFHDIRFGVEGGGEFEIATTRPELLVSCIAVVAHPDDKRYQLLFGKKAITPLFHAPVPIMAAEHADPEKGSGILMVCTFGDIMDVEWWKQSGLPIKQVIGRDGRMMEATHGEGSFVSLKPDEANKTYAKLSGLYIKQARKKIAELLQVEGSAVSGEGSALVGKPQQVMHTVKFFEKGDRPIEFVPTRQWFIKVMDHKKELIEQGKKVEWHPDFMFTRYENWVEGLNQDWCISRQRYFGVSFPVWYPVLEDGSSEYANPIYATQDMLPVDALADTAPGYTEEQRDRPGGFTGDPDIMDTWATSSMSPQINSHWDTDPERHKKLFPMDLRPQAHDIIRTWAFSTIVKAWMHEDSIPWKHIAISGWMVNPDKKKMSKSKGNTVTPGHLLDEYSADGVRYRCAKARLGSDTVFDEQIFKVGKKLVTKVFNAGKFVLMQLERVGANPQELTLSDISEELDLALVEHLREVITKATNAYMKFDYAAALQVSEDAFWNFCDYYLELVKVRSYADNDSAGRRSAIAALGFGLETFLKLLAPVIPYVTEEVWSWSFSGKDGNKSIHTSIWPKIDKVADVPKPKHERSLDAAMEVISHIRGAKTKAQKSQKWSVSELNLKCNEESKEALIPVLDDVLRAGSVSKEGVKFSVNGKPEVGMFETRVVLGTESPE